MKRHIRLININNKASILWIVFLLLIPSMVFSQNKKWQSYQSKKYFSSGQFDKGIAAYKKALKKDSTYFKANYELANVYYYLGQFDSSLVYYKKCIDYPSKKKNYYPYFGYANSLRLLNQPEKALENYQIFENHYKFSNSKSDNELKIDLSIYKSYCKQNIIKKSNLKNDVFVTNIGKEVNTAESEYGCNFLKGDSSIIYIGRYKDFKKEYEYDDDRFFENIYQYNYTDNKKEIFNNYCNQTTHLAIVGVVNNTDSLLIYFKNNLWITNKNKVKEMIPLPNELQGFYHQPSGVFSLDRKTFYFSARPKKGDDLDIFVSHLQNNGKWSLPQVVKEISSDYDDDSPFLSDNDSTLYFSSKGFHSSGDYDIYKSSMTSQGWSAPVSLDYPINSPGDDIYFIINQNDKSFFSSNRKGGYGLMDIYQLQFPPKPTFNCDSFPNTNLTVDLDILNSIDTNSVKLKFDWLFDDGEKFNGTKVTKTFAYPGQHKITINVIDEEANVVEKNEVIEYINIDSVNFVGFTYPNNIILDSNTFLNADVSYVEGEKITHYFWRVNDSVLFSDTSSINYTFNSKGANKVDLQINVLDKNNNYHSYCYSKSLQVITLDEYHQINDETDSLNNNSKDKDYFYSTDSLTQLLTDGTVIDTLYFDPIYFGFDKYYLTKKSKNKLDVLLVYLQKYPSVKIIVAGHTDAMGSDEYNLKLSKKRINSALKYLMNHGLSKERIYKTVGYGESKPIAPNTLPNGRDNANGRAKNRRVEFIIFKGNE